jgi:hypothetical protein
MSESENHKIRLQIEQIIERARHLDEMFLIDSKTAASNILQYLQKENLIATKEAERNNF